MSQPSAVSKPDLIKIYRQALAADLPLDKIDQKIARLWQRATVTEQVETVDTKRYEEQINKSLPAMVRYGALLVPVAFISVGLFLLGNAVIPIAGYYVEKVPSLSGFNLITPIPDEDVLTPQVIAQTNGLVSAYESGLSSVPGYTAEPTIIDTQLDYTNLANWFEGTGLPELAGANGATGSGSIASTEYIIDIPKLKIEEAKVIIGGTDLNNNLIQYPGTADPGSLGAPVIFGHSVLRQFYNPSAKNPRRYVSIFSTIMTLKPGDDIFVTKDGVKYHYRMVEKLEVKPEDVHILTQNYDSRQLKLVTCTPEGTYLRRGVVVAELVS